ncbi:tetratricopeptide repeat protein [Flavobacterium granuli]|uniref:Tetratricopeptide (TPR) repeat protein n=1 Tax=Flavobacterium granuli TaxID=280093 RepID=A0ABU1S4D2_9FLAO|nr:tetratricopeptide repeat protein [Flavobacterium granuli]MDR6845897.1 tetratricopeptide (TPR) repeat protein [Flavobacterium granuli]
MKKVFIYAVATLFSVFIGHAQDIKQAKNAIDAEQYEVAKNTLEAITASKPTDGYAKFLLGNVYLLKGDYEAAQKHFDAGIACSSKGNFNYIGLGYIALDKGNTAEAESNFALATKNSSKKDLEETVYIGKAYTYSENPNYKKAVEILSKSRLIDPKNTDVLLALGDAYKFNKKQNEAYDCYREAFRLDDSLLRAKMGLGTLIKNAHNFKVALTAFDEVIALNANYGPVYRELAETQYLWALNDAGKYNDHISKGLAFYEKYMSLTDYSLESRMRHADFLILAKDYKALETEANEMSKLDKVNPRIYRYLGYSAYHNDNFDTAISSLNSFVSTPTNRVIGRDYYYLGASKLNKALSLTPIDNSLIDNGILDLKKSFEMSPAIAGELSDFGKKLYEKKLYVQSASVYEIAIANPEIKSYLLDNFYFASAIYWSCNGLENLSPLQIEQLNKADGALGKIIAASPTTQDAYLFKARIQVLLKNSTLVAKNYEDFITTANKRDSEELKKMKSKLVEAYNNLGIIYADTDKVKAKDNFDKTLIIDPTNQYAAEQLKALR